MKETHPPSRGFALLTMMLMMALLSAFSVGLFHIVHSETSTSGTDLESMQTLYAASAAMEKMVVDLRNLYNGQLSPAASAIEGLGDSSYHPVLPNVSYPLYELVIPKTGDIPDSEFRNISTGPNQGLMAEISTVSLRATATGSHARPSSMERNVELALIPVFQFGAFSEGNLSYFSDGRIHGEGRIHANGNLFLAAGSSKNVVFDSRVSAAGEIIRDELANGLDTSTVGYTEKIRIPTAPNGCGDGKPACRNLQLDEGSKQGGPGSSDNANWVTLSESTYNGMILNGDTGAKPLSLNFTGALVRPIELIRRPLPLESASSLVGESRLYNQAHVRILISDSAADHPGGAGVRMAGVSPYLIGGIFHGLTDTSFAQADTLWDADYIRPPGALPVGPWELIDGYILVQSRRSDGSYVDVTLEWLNLGIARENPNAVLKFQTLKDDDGDGNPDHAFFPSSISLKFSPLGLYDAREGEVRDTSLGSGSTSCAIGGIINIVELDVGNLKLWLEGNIGSTGTLTDSDNGYIVYFSDRRGAVANPDGDKLGEYGYEDFINPATSSGAPDGALETAEDVNQNSTLDTYGAANLGDGFGVANGDPTIRVDCNTIGRKNRVSGARRGLKLVNGELGNLPMPGFTVATENLLYIQDHYNATASDFGDPHSSAAVIADAVTFLSRDWEDWRSFRYPTYPPNRSTRRTRYRVAVAAGKGREWPHPSWSSNTHYGLDGGIHNFLRYLEDWTDKGFVYKGSLVSLFHSEYGVGTFKCCDAIYRAPNRRYSFDTDFLDATKLPPGTPNFQDVITSASRQVY